MIGGSTAASDSGWKSFNGTLTKGVYSKWVCQPTHCSQEKLRTRAVMDT